MKKILFIISALTMLLAQSCTNQDSGLSDSASNQNLETNSSLYIEREPSTITSVDANKVATLFFTGNSTSTRCITDNEVTEVRDNLTNKTLLYIVNYGQNKGFVLISASKNTSPILAFSDTGHFSLSEKSASSVFISKYKECIRKAMVCTSDSLRLKYALQWASFEKTDIPMVSRAISSDIQEKKNQEIAYKKAQGYRYLGNITAAQYYLPQDQYKSLLKEMESCSDPQYNYMDVVQLFTKTITQKSIEALLKTEWHQRYPFNVDAPNHLAGCVPIAIAQITYYHKYPSKYNWSQIGINPSLNDAFSYFIKDIRNMCVIEYGENGTSSNHIKARDTFRALGYSANITGSPTEDKLSSQIIQKNPVYIRGANSEAGHAWVCDGYRYTESKSVATFIPNPNDPRFKFEEKTPNGFVDYSLHLQNTDSSIGKFFHMNLGWGGDSNGWYNYTTYIYENDKNFPNNQIMITVEIK